MKIHPTAVVDPGAVLADDVEIGPYCIVGRGVRLGPACRLMARVRISGPAAIGARNVLHPNVMIGGAPQDRQPAAADGRIEIGDDNLFREAVTVNLPKLPSGVTRIGSRNRLHFCSHVGHDCAVGHDTVLCSFVFLSGHTVVEDAAWLEGLGGTHQFVTVGRGSWIRSHTKANVDVPPYMWGEGDQFQVKGVNPARRTEALERAFEILWLSDLPRKEALERLDAEKAPEVAELAAFLRRTAGGRMGRSLEGGRS